jgi:Calcineurin-like phosphoesterase
MPVAALYDIHGNLPALEAVIEDVRSARVDAVILGGDVVPGPMPREVLDPLLGLKVPTHFILGNGELAVLAQIGVDDPSEVKYWDSDIIDRWPKTLRLAILGCGEVSSATVLREVRRSANDAGHHTWRL